MRTSSLACLVLSIILSSCTASPAGPQDLSGTWVGSTQSYSHIALALQQHLDTLSGTLELVGKGPLGPPCWNMSSIKVAVIGYLNPDNSFTVSFNSIYCGLQVNGGPVSAMDLLPVAVSGRLPPFNALLIR